MQTYVKQTYGTRMHLSYEISMRLQWPRGANKANVVTWGFVTFLSVSLSRNG